MKNTTSVAIAVYNGDKYLGIQLESIANQTVLPDQVVISDDCSNDQTIRIVEEFRKKAKFEVIYHRNNANLGAAQNFSQALTLCNKDIVFLCDQDDYWFSKKIETVTNLFDKNPSIWLLLHDGEIADENLHPSGVTKMSQVISGYGHVGNMATGALTAVRRDFLNICLPIPVGLKSHDIWVHKVSKLCPNRRMILDEVLQFIRRHDDNTSSWVVNRGRKISKSDVWISKLKTISADSYEDRFILNKHLQIKLSAAYYLIGFSNQQIDDFRKRELKYLQDEFIALNYRTEIINTKNRLVRILKSLKMLIKCHYKYFNGASSFLRDILR